jgi:uncharacterized MnhB-related membrane protein
MGGELSAVDWLLVGILIATAAACLMARELTRSVVLFVAFGLLLALVWARLGATDLAIAEAAIGAGVTGALLLDALGARRRGQGGEAGDG